MKLKLLIALLAMVAFVCVVQYANTNRRASRPITIGFSHIGTDSHTEWYDANVNSIKQAARDADMTLIMAFGKNKRAQIENIHRFIEEKVDVIGVVPIEEVGWDDVLWEAKKYGIPVITVDRDIKTIDDSLVAARIAANTYVEGRRVFEWIDAYAAKLNLRPKNGNVFNIAVIEGPDTVSASLHRKEGFKDAMLASPDIRSYNILAERSGNLQRDSGQKIMTELLNSCNGQIDIVFAHNDEMIIGAITAIEKAGLSPGKDIITVSVDRIAEALTAMEAGKLNCSIECNPRQGDLFIEETKKVLRGQKAENVAFVKENVFSADIAARIPSEQK